MNQPIHLIVGLANPGEQYAKTRHNAGAWFVEKLAQHCQKDLRVENKFHGEHTQIKFQQYDCHLLIPHTFMNLSGQSIGALAKFYKIAPQNILVAHDELDLAPGIIRLKFDGGHGGHNGLRDTINHLGTNQFHRLRIGIGHPGHKDQVVDYVLKQPGKQDRRLIDDAIGAALDVMPTVISGHMERAMHKLHSRKD